MNAQTLELRLFRTLESDSVLSTLAEEIENLLGVWVFFNDYNWNVLAYSPGAQKDFQERVKKRGDSDFDSYTNEVTRRIERGGPKPFIIDGPLIGKKQLIVKTFFKGVYLGHISLQDGSQSLNDLSPDILTTLANVFSIALRLDKNGNEEFSSRVWTGLLHDLLKGKFSNRTEFIQRLHSTSTLYSIDNVGVAIVESRGGEISPVVFRETVALFAKHISYVTSCRIENSMVCLFDTALGWPEDFFNGTLLHHAHNNHLFIGYDNSCVGLFELKALFHNARRAVQFARNWNSQSPIRSYDESKLYDLFMDAKPRSGTLNQYIAKAVAEMRAHDNDNNTDYYHTLCVYLRNRTRATITAKQLFIHKTTLSYRLNRMSELFSVDWDNPDQMLRLHISVYILENLSM